MRWFRFAVLILAAVLLQAGLLTHLSTKPDLLIILLVFFAIHRNTSEAIITSFTIGFAADLITMVGSGMGPRIISFGLFGTALAYLNRFIAIRKMPYQSLAIFVTAFLTGIMAHFLARFGRGQPAVPNIYTELFWISLCSAIVGPFLFLPLAWWMRIKIRRFGRH